MLRHQFTCGCLIAAVLASPVSAQEPSKPLPGDEMIYKYLCAETDKLSKKFMDGAKTLDEWKDKLPRLKREYMDMLGLWPIPEKTPLKAAVTGQIEAHGVIVEKVHFQSKPGLYVTANLYRPKAQGRPSLGFPAIVYVCGHANRGRDGNKSAYQEHGFWFANNGYVCLTLDTLQLGEIPGVHHGTYGVPWNHLNKYEASRERKRPEDKVRWWWHSAGYTPAGVECWNGIRAIDYLLTRPDVDPDKIGVTGISGGGAATFWIAAADERVKVAVPVSGMSDLESYIKNKVINGHCDCMFLYNTYQWDWTTIAALVAPRPLLFANSDNDPIFPMDGNRRIMEKLRKLYGMYDDAKAHGRPSVGLQEYVSAGGHAYRPDLRIEIFKFINKHLKGDTTTPVEDSAKYTPLPGKDLRVFPTDADMPKDAINRRIDETFVPRAKVELPGKGKFAEWRKTIFAQLQPNLRANPEQIAPAVILPQSGQFEAWMSSEPDTKFYYIDGRPGGMDGTKWSIRNDKNEDAASEIGAKIGWPSLILFPRGISEPWTSKSPPNYVERSHALLGRTVDEGRLRDILSVRLRWRIAGWKMHTHQLSGHGQAGILAAYAALFEPSIKEVVVINPPKSHKEGPHFLGILRVLDIPEALGLLAPTPLTIIGGMDPAFDRTAEIYRLAGAADKLKRK